MATLKVSIQTTKNADTLQRDYERSNSAKYADVQAISDLLLSVLSGSQSQPSIQVSIPENASNASGTLTLASVVATNTCSINGVTFTAIASGATGNQFNVGVSNTATALNLANAINASSSALVQGYVTASSSGAVVTITSSFPGIAGNQTTIAGGTNITSSATRLSGGAEDPNAQTYSF